MNHGQNIASASRSFVGGGWGHRALTDNAFIGGGLENYATGSQSFIGGGQTNEAAGKNAFVAGGFINKALGENSFATGWISTASGAYSFAAGEGAEARHDGTFVWSDTGPATVSTGPDQFLVEAAGGVGINTVSPLSELHVKGPSAENRFDGQLRIEASETDGGAGQGGAISFQGHDGDIPRVWAAIRGVKRNGTVTNKDARLRFYVRNDSSGMEERMRIDADGTTFNSTGSWAMFSDRRLKEDIRPLDGALDRLMALEGVTFRYRNPSQALGAAGPRTGFVAQQVRTVFPEWVGETEDGVMFVDTAGFEALTVEALRELRAESGQRLSVAESKLEALETENRRLSARNHSLEMRLNALERAIRHDASLQGGIQ